MKNIYSKKIKLVFAVLILIAGLVFALTDKDSNKSKKSVNPKENNSQEITPEVESAQDQQIPQTNFLGTEKPAIFTERASANVVRVRDGDTIEVDFGEGNVKTVRYIGIDTPETVDPRKGVQCFGIQASMKNKELVEGKTVQLERDISETDKYGRLLRYVYVGDIFVNEALVSEGFAHASYYPPDIKYQELFEEMEAEARVNNKGLWGSCNSPAEVSGARTTQTNSTADDKDCSGFATQQEAQEYFNSKGGSPSNNVDKLDGSDRDGIVCESLL